ncbi:hypothetical protein DXG01_004739 [Tephrocybe rancida]|nr:hypothetical protein DXG01_004739 [Tephrocybe rancida]
MSTQNAYASHRSAEIALSEAMGKLKFPAGPSLVVYIPPEILEEIFRICAAAPLTRGERPNRLAISQVCQQWRLITLNNPWIWGRLEAGSPKMATELLSRSEGAFLDIVAAPDTHMIKIRGVDLQPHTKRIRSFDIAFRREYELGNLFSKIGDEFPNLASMSLNSLNYLYSLDPILSKGAPFSPRIERLELRGVAVQWIPKLADMTFLELRGIGWHQPGIQLLHTILKASPRLEHLSLDGVHTQPVPTGPLPPVSLPLLRILYLEEEESVIFALLPLMSIPKSTRIFLDFRYSKSRRIPNDQENTRVFIEGDNIKLLRPAELESYDSPGSARLTVPDGHSPSSFLAGLSTAFDLTTFTSLDLNKSLISFLPIPFLVDISNRFIGVHTLRIGPSDREPSHYAPPRALAPGSYASPTATPPGGQDAALDPNGSNGILAIAQGRQGLGVPLRLVDVQIPIPAGVVERLKTMVPIVVKPNVAMS